MTCRLVRLAVGRLLEVPVIPHLVVDLGEDSPDRRGRLPVPEERELARIDRPIALHEREVHARDERHGRRHVRVVLAAVEFDGDHPALEARSGHSEDCSAPSRQGRVRIVHEAERDIRGPRVFALFAVLKLLEKAEVAGNGYTHSSVRPNSAKIFLPPM